jgi:hypothetical protein
MASKNRLTSVDAARNAIPLYGIPLYGPVCHCLAEFFRQEFLKHHQCLERQREYYSDVAIAQAEDALSRAMAQIEGLCQRDDACEVIGRLLRQIDAVTKLSAWTDSETLN